MAASASGNCRASSIQGRRPSTSWRRRSTAARHRASWRTTPRSRPPPDRICLGLPRLSRPRASARVCGQRDPDLPRMDRLPPLNAIRAFEAAARHLSITLAADELHVTAGAVSRQIKGLEEVLGVQLLTRGHRQIALTRQGGDYYRAVARALDGLRDATRRLKRRGQRKQLRVRAYTTFAMRWLIPRLSGFQAQHPDIEVLLKASLEPVDFRKEDIDGAVRLGDGRWPDTKA